MNRYDCIGVLWILLGPVLFYYSMYMLSNIRDYSMYEILETLLSFENQYVLLFFFATAYFLIEYGFGILDAAVNNGIQELKYTKTIEEKEQRFKAR